jgi:hypothetical protein
MYICGEFSGMAAIAPPYRTVVRNKKCIHGLFNPLTPELNPSAQRCLTRYFTGDFAS